MTAEFENTIDQTIHEYVTRVKQWLSYLLVWYGMHQGMTEVDSGQPHDRKFSLSRFDPSNLEYYWRDYYTAIHIVMVESETIGGRLAAERGSLSGLTFGPSGNNLNDLMVFGRDHDHLHPQVVTKIVVGIESEIASCLPGIYGKNSYRACSIPQHLLDDKKTGFHLSDWGKLDMCRKFGPNYFCDDCIQRFGLNGQQTPVIKGLTTKQKNILKSFTPTLRASILVRDNYTCSKCQRSPLEGYDITLNVKHIIPVSTGGTNDPENLATFCQRCTAL